MKNIILTANGFNNNGKRSEKIEKLFEEISRGLTNLRIYPHYDEADEYNK